MIQNKALTTISQADIENLLSISAQETQTLEFKQTFPPLKGKEFANSSEDFDKKEFLKDISAMANTSGGDIIYGIAEKREEKLVGISIDNAERFERRLQDIIVTGIEPYLNIAIKTLALQNGKSLIIIRVPHSFNAPHWVRENKKFYGRKNHSTYEFPLMELRDMFIKSELSVQKMKDFRTKRIEAINKNNTPISMNSKKPKVILHLLPLDAFRSQGLLDLGAIQHAYFAGVTGHPWPYPLRESLSNIEPRFNFDGLLFFNSTAKDNYFYFQLYRNAIIETVATHFFDEKLDGRNTLAKLIVDTCLEKIVRESIKNNIKFYQQYNVQPPFYICLTLVGVKDYKLQTPFTQPSRQHYSTVIDRDILMLPEISFESYEEEKNLYKLIKPLFDMIWNACGHAQSEN